MSTDWGEHHFRNKISVRRIKYLGQLVWVVECPCRRFAFWTFGPANAVEWRRAVDHAFHHVKMKHTKIETVELL